MSTPIKIETTPIVVQSDGTFPYQFPLKKRHTITTTQPDYRYNKTSTAWKPITRFEGEKPNTFFGQVEKIAGDSGHTSDNVSAALQLGLQFANLGKAS